MVLLDAQSTGMPVIATKHCDIPDEVADGKTGILANEKDIRHLSQAIARFYRMGSDEYRAFAMAARAHVESHYNIKTNARIMRETYDDLAVSHLAGHDA